MTMSYQSRPREVTSILRVAFVLTIIVTFPKSSDSQKLCKFSSSTSFQNTNTSIFLQNFSSQKCLQVEGFGFKPQSIIRLGECSYWKTATKDQQYLLANNTLNKFMIKTDSGGGEFYCLTSNAGASLKSTLCDPQSFDQSWTLKPVQSHPGQFLLEQYSSKKCLKPKSLATRAEIQLSPCNSYQTEQIWKICSKL